MRKVAVAALAVCMMALVFASVPAVSAASEEDAPMVCSMTATFDLSTPSEPWKGSLTGCAIAGSLLVYEKPDVFFAGNTEHFFEDFVITTSTGVISGVDQGVWDFTTFKFRANGWVTDATGDWSYLVGYKLHESGHTSAVPPLEGTLVILSGTMFLVAP